MMAPRVIHAPDDCCSKYGKPTLPAESQPAEAPTTWNSFRATKKNQHENARSSGKKYASPMANGYMLMLVPVSTFQGRNGKYWPMSYCFTHGRYGHDG